MPIINGRRVTNVPDSGVYGSEIIGEFGKKNGRRVVIGRGTTEFETIEAGKRYTKRELLDRKGSAVKVFSIPDRTKGGS